jgi:hypothetical protein
VGPQEGLTIAAGAVEPAPGIDAGTAPRARPVPWVVFAGVAVLGVAAAVWSTRGFFLFNDDYLFLGQADRTPLGFGYLTEGLFQHFSPVSRLLNAMAVGVLPEHGWVARAVMLLLYAAYVGAVLMLSVVLIGRTWLGLLTFASLATSLAVLPLANWWTAALNILPALTGSALCLAGAVALARGRSTWWGVLAFIGYLVAVLDYETAVLVPAYAVLWVVLFPGPDGRVSLGTLWRRTGWLWVALGVVGVLTLVNYRVNYYVDTAGASLGEYAEAMARSLGQVQLPLVLGFSDLDHQLFSWCGTALAALGVLALLLRAVRRPAMWKGLIFALAGWLLPSAALVLNRIGVVGQPIVKIPYYYGLSTMLLVVGIAAALAAAVDPAPLPGRLRTWLPVVGVVVVALAWIQSVGPSTQIVWVAGQKLFGDKPPATDRFVSGLIDSAADLEPDATVLNGNVPESLVWAEFAPYNRLDRVAAISGIDLDFDQPDRPAYVATTTGRLVPVDLQWREQLDVRTGTEAGLRLTDVRDLEPGDDGLCFRSTATSSVEWVLPDRQRADRLVVRADVRVDRRTAYRLFTASAGSTYAPANGDDKAWDPDSTSALDTVVAHRVDQLAFMSFTPGAKVCLAALAVGEAVVAP